MINEQDTFPTKKVLTIGKLLYRKVAYWGL